MYHFPRLIRSVIFIVDSSLKFDKNISLIVHKAMNIEQILPDTEMFSDRVLLTKAFCTYVHPILEYCSPVWSPHFKYLITKNWTCSEIFYKKIERLLEHALRTEIDHSVPGISKTSTFGYSGISDPTWPLWHWVRCYFCIIDNSRTWGHAYKLLKPHCTTDATKYFFSNHVTSTGKLARHGGPFYHTVHLQTPPFCSWPLVSFIVVLASIRFFC